ncbi:MAG: tetratricopeptide repeat protein [Coleofasciculus sp. D1-CHI-01]|uniref:tetratricopeptide repeat protein n=1 Tax=Coleofasciculus sp. D1-CHI-01 TaxID=3068482 RepID=UPI0032FF6FCC
MSNDNVAALLQQGHEQLDRGQNQAALQIFQQAEQREPENPQVLFGLGLACYRLEQYQESVDYLTKTLDIEPCHILALARRGTAYRGLKLEESATADFEQVLQLEPQTHQDWRGRGIALYELKRYEDAIACFDKAIEINPDDYNAWNNRGNALYDLGKYQDAIASCDKAIEINPDDYYPWGNRGNALNKLGKHQDAIASFDKVIEINPDDYNAWRNRGDALYELGKYQEALASYDKAIEINPDDYNAWINRGVALNNLGKYQEALASCDKAIEINPDDYNAWINRGVALNNLGKYQEALASYDKAIEINPDYYNAWINRGWALFDLKRYEETFQNWEDGREHLNSETPEHREGRGQLYYNEAKAYYKLGRTEVNLEKLLKAERCYQKAFKLLDTAKCRQRQLEILQDLIRVCQYISTPKRVKELLNQGTDLLERWLQDSNFSDENYIHFKQKFAGFNQYQVDILAQSSEREQQIQALELAEERKNTCLGWLQYGKAYNAPPLTYNQIQRQLNPRTAAIYWHISPAAITTFILEHNQLPQILQLQPIKSKKKRSPFPFFNQPKKSYPATANQLREFEDWLNQWKQDYRHYSQA